MNDITMDREWQRLLALYADKADEELLELHERRGDLTELAQQALDRTLKERGIEAEGPVAPEPEGSTPQPPELDEDEVFVGWFEDSIRASTARTVLDRAGVPHRLVVNRYDENNAFDRSPATISLFVDKVDEVQARELLEREMNLTFLPRGSVVSETMEGDTVLGEFSPAQVEVVKSALAERGIACTTEHSEFEGFVRVNVSAERLDEAFDLMEEIADTLPGEDE